MRSTSFMCQLTVFESNQRCSLWLLHRGIDIGRRQTSDSNTSRIDGLAFFER